jgi:hypothetical protein
VHSKEVKIRRKCILGIKSGLKCILKGIRNWVQVHSKVVKLVQITF